MAAKQNLELVEQLQHASREQDYERFGALLADDAVSGWPVCRRRWAA